MRTLRSVTDSELLLIAAAAATFPAPPTTWAVVPAWWNGGKGSGGVVPEFELEVWAAAAVSVTNAVLYGAVPETFTYAPNALTSASSVTSKFTKTAHGLLTGDGNLFLTNVGGATPANTSPGVPYWAIVDTADTFALASSLANALAGIPIALGDNGTGTTTIQGDANTERIHWTTHDGLLGLAGDGAVSLTAQLGYRKRVPHSPRVVAYALAGTLASAVAISASLAPIDELP